MKRLLLVAMVATCVVLSNLGGSGHAQTLPTGQVQSPVQSQVQANRLFGTYPADVVSTQDSTQHGRLLLRIYVTSTATELWAQPSVPYVDGTVASIKLPPTGSAVWVQFVAGDPTRPLWVGWTPR